MQESLLLCPSCESSGVVVTAEQMFYINTSEHYCHSVKIQDSDAQAACLNCDWAGERHQLIGDN
jgi:Zn finger protein HypA/HybF involved in hydrogenase expression